MSNPLEMTDEEFLNTPEPNIEEEVQEEEIAPVEESSEETEVSTQETDESPSEEENEASTDSSQKEENIEEESEEVSEIDYKAEYERLTSPFKANGKEMQVSTSEDILNLMKMGANYNKKMSGLKPSLKIVKMLENNDLLDETKLSHLIDLDKKNPEAIEKLFKDSGIDPLDIDTEKEDEYKPNTYTVNDKEVELDAVLDEIRDTPAFEDTINIIGKKWDSGSKEILLENPKLIGVINEHVENGIYEQISSIIENERMLGRLTDLTDLEAYKQVGDNLNANNGFVTQKQQTPGTSTVIPKQKKQTINSADESKRNAKKEAASNTQTSPSSNNKKSEFNPLSMSDADFEKASSDLFI